MSKFKFEVRGVLKNAHSREIMPNYGDFYDDDFDLPCTGLDELAEAVDAVQYQHDKKYLAALDAAGLTESMDDSAPAYNRCVFSNEVSLDVNGVEVVVSVERSDLLIYVNAGENGEGLNGFIGDWCLIGNVAEKGVRLDLGQSDFPVELGNYYAEIVDFINGLREY